MKWEKLLSSKRRSSMEKNPHPQKIRSDFERDYDRIIFSHPFRKLQNKTQVFPLPEDDFVHNRLTHSLEVFSVGRSLGRMAGEYLNKKYPSLKENLSLNTVDLSLINTVGSIVGAACLAHDIGNPPFGHAGEKGISSFFDNNDQFKDQLSKEEREDLTNFEGNAQGFRLLNSPLNKGLNLTYATLGAFTKYPLSSASKKNDKRISHKKYGFYQSESTLFEQIFNEMEIQFLGDHTWCRHPLAFLVEAADDICYHIIDLEDGGRLGLVPFQQIKKNLAEILKEKFSEKKLAKIPSLNEKLGSLRAMTINQLIEECFEVFQSKEQEILNGEFDQSLISQISSQKILEDIKKISTEKIYHSKQVNEKEVGGYEMLETLTSFFSSAFYDHQLGKPSNKQKTTIRLVPEEYSIHLKNQKSVYEILRTTIDFISGLTDSHTVKLYKMITGHRFLT